MRVYWQALNGRANLHDGLARVDRTAGDTWRRPRGEDILLVQVKQVLRNVELIERFAQLYVKLTIDNCCIKPSRIGTDTNAFSI